MATTYSWANTNRPAIGSMTSTTKFDDVAPGDRTTGETTTTALAFNAGLGYNAGTGYLTALCDLGALAVATAWRATGVISAVSNPGNRPGAATSYVLEYSSDGSSWTTAASGSLIFSSFNDFSGSLSSVAARYWRLVVTASEYSDLAGSFTIQLTDFRITSTVIVPVVLTASTTVSLSAGGIPTQQARVTNTFSFVATLITVVQGWSRDCGGSVVSFARSCGGTAATFVRTCAGAVTSWTKRNK